jgi:hypothetical protein
MRTIVNMSFLILTFVINSQVNQLDSLGRKNGVWIKKLGRF